MSSFESSNSFSPLFTNIQSPDKLNVANDPYQTRKAKFKHAVLKVLNINLRSINSNNKKYELHAILDQVKPDIVIGTETWLNSDIHNSEIIPDELEFEVFRRDRGSRGGGVFILVSNRYIAHREQHLETNCEILWVKLELNGWIKTIAYCSILPTP